MLLRLKKAWSRVKRIAPSRHKARAARIRNASQQGEVITQETRPVVLNEEVVQDSDLRLPPELWSTIFRFMHDQRDVFNASMLVPVTRICKAFQILAEAILYRDVRLRRSVRQFDMFASSVAARPRHAAAVRSLWLNFFPSAQPEVAILKATMRVLANLADLSLHHVMSFDAIFDDSIPFKLHTLRLAQGAFERLHQFASCNVELQAARPWRRINALSQLRVLLITSNDQWSGSDASASTLNRLSECCYLYVHLTHLRINCVPSWTCVHDIFRSLGRQLIALKIAIHRDTHNGTLRNHGDDEFPKLWPTDHLSGTSFPLLRYLELDDGHQDYRFPSERHFGEFRRGDWQSACPSIKTFVWNPPNALCRFAMRAAWYREAFPALDAALFDSWTTLERLERPQLELEEAGQLFRSVPHFAYTRGADGMISGRACERDVQLWQIA